MRFSPVLLFAVLLRPNAAVAGPDSLKFLIAIEQARIPSPFAARITMNLHNAGQDTVWIYRRARALAKEGPTLEVHLEPAEALPDAMVEKVARGAALETVGLAHPKLVRLAAGEDYEEKGIVRILPVTVRNDGEGKPWWGRYRLSLIYRAKFSNAPEMARITGATLWEGEVTSNALDVEIASPSAEGSISGRVLNPNSQPLDDVLVSLSDQEERLVDQTTSDREGKYSFDDIPPGVYWVTARRTDVAEETAVFRHVLLSPAELQVTQDLVMLPHEVYEAKDIMHKPVLLRVLDGAGHPLDRVALDAIWSSGTVLDTVKSQTSADGMVALELIPGRNFLTLKRHGCTKDEQRLDVAAGEGVDGFKLTLDCGKKAKE